MQSHPAAAILSIAYHLPAGKLTNSDIAMEFPEWGIEKVEAKTGIKTRHIAAPKETSVDLAFTAAEKLFANTSLSRKDIDFIILCTQSPDYVLPTSACILQDRLGVDHHAGALDINLGCSGFVYCLGLAKGLIETSQAKNILILTAETYSKMLHPQDKSVRTIFGDGAAAIWVGARSQPADGRPYIGCPLYGSDGSGAKNLIVEKGGFRAPGKDDTKASFLHMNGPAIFQFTLDAVAKNIQECLEKNCIGVDELDLLVPHQANAFMLESIRKKLAVPRDKFAVHLAQFGNTVSATIPIALAECVREKTLNPGAKIMVSGFGVGYSWASAILRWHPDFVLG